MSHVEVNPNFVILSLDCIERAAKSLGLQLNRGQKTWKWYGSWVDDFDKDTAAYKHGILTEDYGKCIHAIANPATPGGYEIGLVRNPDEKVGGFLPIKDKWGTGKGLEQIVGENCSKLAQHYKHECCQEFADSTGYSYEWAWEGGNITGTITDYNQ